MKKKRQLAKKVKKTHLHLGFRQNQFREAGSKVDIFFLSGVWYKNGLKFA